MKIFNKKGHYINQFLLIKSQELSFFIFDWGFLCKICKPLYMQLSNDEYIKFKWMYNTAIFWRENNKIYKELK